jgi:hypothetical protein
MTAIPATTGIPGYLAGCPSCCAWSELCGPNTLGSGSVDLLERLADREVV